MVLDETLSTRASAENTHTLERATWVGACYLLACWAGLDLLSQPTGRMLCSNMAMAQLIDVNTCILHYNSPIGDLIQHISDESPRCVAVGPLPQPTKGPPAVEHRARSARTVVLGLHNELLAGHQPECFLRAVRCLGKLRARVCAWCDVLHTAPQRVYAYMYRGKELACTAVKRPVLN